MEGVDAVLDAFLADRDRMSPGIAAARALSAVDVGWRELRDRVLAAERSVVLACRDSGPLLAARAFRPGQPTSIHDHGHAGAALVVEGLDRYERFRRLDDTTAGLESVHDLAVGDVVWWNAPPDDIHRQTGRGQGAIELVLLAGPPGERSALQERVSASSELRDAFIRGFLDGDAAVLAPWYDDDVLVDMNVPEWRHQLCGRERLLELLHREEFTKPGRRLSFLRPTDTAEGLLLETETRFTDAGVLRLFREVHNLRCRGGLVAEHVVWCSGISDEAKIRSQFATAPMQRL